MEALFAILWVIAITAITMKMNKKQQQMKKKVPSRIAAKPMKIVEEWINATPPQTAAESVGTVPEDIEGPADHDEEGCVGGSMAHDRHEGESRAEHRRHMAAVTRREREEVQAREAAESAGSVNVRRLREAVVMAEILDKPVALRGRRG